MTENICVEKVWRQGGWHSYQCSRKAGFGPNEAYCKTHAKRHDKSEPTITLWKTSFNYIDWKSPIETVFVREVSDKTFLDASGRRNGMKTEYAMHFTTEKEAHDYLRRKAPMKKSDCMETIKNIDKFINSISAKP